MNSELAISFHILGYLTSRGGEPLTSEQMARTYGTSPVVLRRVLAKLQRAGLVETRRGVGGGSVLACEPGAITLRDAYEAVAADTEILRKHPGGCHERVAKVVSGFVNEICREAEDALLAQLESVTVAEMDREIRSRLGCG
ncbi:MAG: Rrf2 family transcriptional regulator [Phycisphaerales bacterium]